MAKINNLAIPGGGGIRTPCPPSGSAHAFANTIYRIRTKVIITVINNPHLFKFFRKNKGKTINNNNKKKTSSFDTQYLAVTNIFDTPMQTFQQMSRHTGKPTICLGENKGADQLRSNCEADQRFCDSTIPTLLNSKISSF